MSQVVRDATAVFNDLLLRYEADLDQIYHEFILAAVQQKLTFGGRPVFAFLRPNFLSRLQYEELQFICRVLRGAVTKFKEAALSSPAMMEQAGLIDRERELVQIYPGFDRLSITARWDSFMQSDGTVRFVELNAESPAGIAYSDVASSLYRTLPFVRDFLVYYEVEKWNVRGTLLGELLSTYEHWQGNKRSAKPSIAIVDWRDVPTFTEFELFGEYFRSAGFRCAIADPRDLTYEHGRLRNGEFEIDLVYKRILTNDCVERPVETRALVEAARNRDICLINPFRAKMVHKKSIFSVLTHEKNSSLFTGEELAVIMKHIPWTRMVAREHTLFHGQRIDLIDYITAHKDLFVIKPNDEYGGKGVVIGREVDVTEWAAAISEGLNGEPFVVQEAVELPRQSFPIMRDGSLAFVDMVVDMDPYVFGEKVDGVLTRLSASSLANVTAGGGTTPTFVIDEIVPGPHRVQIGVQRPSSAPMETGDSRGTEAIGKETRLRSGKGRVGKKTPRRTGSSARARSSRSSNSTSRRARRKTSGKPSTSRRRNTR
jgi:uncharacterized circularly permuted ATP-grasp superfamily protein